MNPNRFDGRVALVTGAARGIGARIAATLAERGATVAQADVAQDWAGLTGGTHTRHRVDVRSAPSCQDLVAEVLDRHGRLDLLVNNAGVVRRGPAATMSEEDFTTVLDVNLTGTFRMCQAAYPALRAARGAVVNLGSTNGHIAVLDTVGYCVSKAGVLHLTRVLALEWAPDQVRVNAVGPTIVPTDMTTDVRGDATYLADKLATIPLGRMAEPADVANAVAYLLSTAAAMVTGQTIFVDGGVTIH
ncbi:NAD(P)-dependent dehydrogenase, short-chain alcohol dehydrogenase family [Micromonospora pallida]|uniref:NAD(P)-dependent dehydrogenase, short-chain alcohol dehydrogenase family n=1 Tax=Micromonospora pallida TaxID=145854 RepID=A0A1C6RUZ3_9ACTN|nr:SDR family NAD(P)-dependent oxidoreductase [Micromonospora pallida]SCL20879.1 NAD(P)-dependent dehydrogenase, short-chain alcohol dehydrogenase family [Micromonospora pallida]